MKNLMTYVNPRKDFDPESQTAIKIQIDNSLRLGWPKTDIMLYTNFAYEYNGVKSVLIDGENYCAYYQPVTKVNNIVELFDRKLIQQDEIYWYHDLDVYQLDEISESELELGSADMALAERGNKDKLDSGSIFFKSSAEDIFAKVKEIAYHYEVSEEYTLNAFYHNNRLWITEPEHIARTSSVPLDLPGTKNFNHRIKKLNVSYNFGIDVFNQIYPVARKPIKVVHFHFREDILLDSCLYGENNLKQAIMPAALVKIFNHHGVNRVFPKRVKNLMIYLNAEQKFEGNSESLLKQQIDHSLKLGWKKADIVLLTNFPYEYQGIKAIRKKMPVDLLPDSAVRTDSLHYLLQQEMVQEAELWWYHDLDVFQLQPITGLEIDLGDSVAFFRDDGALEFATNSLFFRRGAQKLFEWIRNRTVKLGTDDQTAFETLTITNYRNINAMYKSLPKELTQKFARQGEL